MLTPEQLNKLRSDSPTIKSDPYAQMEARIRSASKVQNDISQYKATPKGDSFWKSLGQELTRPFLRTAIGLKRLPEQFEALKTGQARPIGRPENINLPLVGTVKGVQPI